MHVPLLMCHPIVCIYLNFVTSVFILQLCCGFGFSTNSCRLAGKMVEIVVFILRRICNVFCLSVGLERHHKTYEEVYTDVYMRLSCDHVIKYCVMKLLQKPY